MVALLWNPFEAQISPIDWIGSILLGLVGGDLLPFTVPECMP